MFIVVFLVVGGKSQEYKKVGDTVVELDAYRYKLGTYKAPLQEVRDSL